MQDQGSFSFEGNPHPGREFLGWDAPLLDSVTTWLLNKPEDLSRMLVVTPTSNSGRRLRLALSNDGGVLAPHVMAPSRLFEVDGVATRQQSLWAWTHVIQQLDVEDFPHLFPSHLPGSTRGFSAALALARQMVTLRDMLAEGDADFRVAQNQSSEKERWRELATLESEMLQCLGRWKLRDSVLATREKAHAPVLPPGVSQVVVACVPDPTLLASRALENILASGVPVTVLVHAPSSEADSFDSWGVPRTDVWTQKEIDIPDWSQRLHVVDSSTEAAELCERLFAEEKSPSDGAALALCDATFAPALQKTFGSAGWPLFEPDGSGIADTGVMRMLRVMRDLVGRGQSFEALREWVRLPGTETFLPPKTSRHWASGMLDKLHLEHLPETISDAAALASSHTQPILDAVTAKLDELTPGKLAGTLRTWLSDWLMVADAAVAQAAEAGLAEALEAVDHMESHGDYPQPDEVFEMLAESVQSTRVTNDRSATVLDLQGWLELSYDPAPHLVLAGMHEECVPEGTADDAFVPDSLRKNLGLRDSHGRFARDAFLLQSALRSRSESGRVDAVVARFNDAGEARKPSRLLMRQHGAKLAAVVNHLFAESRSSQSRGGPWHRDWSLNFPQVKNPYAPGDEPRKISPSAIKDYLNCPARFFLKRIVGMHPYESGKREMNAMDFGNICHGVVESFGKDNSIRDSTDAGEIDAYCSDQLDRQMEAKYGRRISLPLMVQLESARERLRAFAVKQAAERALGWKIVATELRVGVDDIAWEIAGHPVNMTIDRIDCHEDEKRWRVWDYKTSGKAHHPQDQHQATWKDQENRPLLAELIPAEGRKKERRWSDVQLPLYAAFVQQHFNTSELPEVGYINLPRAVSDVDFCRWTGFDPSVVDHARTWAEAAVEKIRAGEFSQPAILPLNEREWDDFGELAPDGLTAAFGIS
ncbi:MAG: PD-(D/E)XK nuclease family protein [Verrucomicrobiae bacterium]|nr:PD-(D/E)XK nuclease family protein [Verrucomicrobiae bacterium]NNJ43516.1 hypothetical protein [Akkermansiaceae bacterium]